MTRQARRIVSISFVLALLGACGGADSIESAGRTAEVSGDMEERGADGVAAQMDSDSNNAIGYASDEGAGGSEVLGDPGAAAPAGTARGQAQAPTHLDTGPKIIKTATVRVGIDHNRFQAAVHEATTVAERYGGYVVSTTVDDHGRGFAAATLRIPSERFGAAMGAVRGLGTVRSEEITGEDVTQQVIDLEARLRNLRAQETVLLRLMNDARSVIDTIRVQQHLSDVQLEIERIRGRLSYLDDQVSFSTIFVEMREVGAGSDAKIGTIGRAWQRALDGALSVVGGVIVGAGYAAPFALMALLAMLLFRVVRPRWHRRAPSAG